MTRDETLNLLRNHSAEIRERFGVKRLAVFGSTTRGEARDDSDVDVMVEFHGHPTFDGYFHVKFLLEDLLQRNVDLATSDMIRKEIRSYVEQDLVEVFHDLARADMQLQENTQVCR